jgi:hypothetical protein
MLVSQVYDYRSGFVRGLAKLLGRASQRLRRLFAFVFSPSEMHNTAVHLDPTHTMSSTERHGKMREQHNLG